MEANEDSMTVMLVGMVVILALLVYSVFIKNKKTETPVCTNTVTPVDKSLYSVFLDYFPTAAMFINTIIYYNNNIYGSTGNISYTYMGRTFTRGASGNIVYGSTGYNIPLTNNSRINYDKSVMINDKYKSFGCKKIE
jgi:hypothetical protein